MPVVVLTTTFVLPNTKPLASKSIMSSPVRIGGGAPIPPYIEPLLDMVEPVTFTNVLPLMSDRPKPPPYMLPSTEEFVTLVVRELRAPFCTWLEL